MRPAARGAGPRIRAARRRERSVRPQATGLRTRLPRDAGQARSVPCWPRTPRGPPRTGRAAPPGAQAGGHTCSSTLHTGHRRCRQTPVPPGRGRAYQFWYAGVDDVYVRAGEWVKKGATIARVATNGIDATPRVAFGVYRGATPIDHTGSGAPSSPWFWTPRRTRERHEIATGMHAR